MKVGYTRMVDKMQYQAMLKSLWGKNTPAYLSRASLTKIFFSKINIRSKGQVDTTTEEVDNVLKLFTAVIYKYS